MLRQNWIAASEKVWLRPRLPLSWPNHCMLLSSQMDSDPLALSAALYCGQLIVQYLLRTFLFCIIRRGYQLSRVDLCNKADRAAEALRER